MYNKTELAKIAGPAIANIAISELKEQKVVMINDDLQKNFYNFQKMSVIYQAGIKEITTRLENLDDEFSTMYERNPIQNIQSRIKSPASIMEKLDRRGLPATISSAMQNLNDIAGVRVVCSYIGDVYFIADMLKQQNDIIIVEEKDYIENQKPNGYRSLHLILKVPVFLSNQKECVKVEVQIRTIAMDYWASLEHHLNYKLKETIPDELVDELRQCAAILSDVENRMQGIKDKVFGLIQEDSDSFLTE